MSAIITDQFRILNANNFVESVENTNNSYYVFIGLPNPAGTGSLVGYGRSSDWNSSTPAPTDSFSYRIHTCLLYTSPSPRDRQKSRMPSSA